MNETGIVNLKWGWVGENSEAVVLRKSYCAASLGPLRDPNGGVLQSLRCHY